MSHYRNVCPLCGVTIEGVQVAAGSIDPVGWTVLPCRHLVLDTQWRLTLVTASSDAGRDSWIEWQKGNHMTKTDALIGHYDRDYGKPEDCPIEWHGHSCSLAYGHSGIHQSLDRFDGRPESTRDPDSPDLFIGVLT